MPLRQDPLPRRCRPALADALPLRKLPPGHRLGFTSFFAIANGHWRWVGDAPALYRSSPGVERRFCPTCGTPMSYSTARAPDEMHFYAATLDDPERYRPTAHDLATEQLSWVVLCDGLPAA